MGLRNRFGKRSVVAEGTRDREKGSTKNCAKEYPQWEGHDWQVQLRHLLVKSYQSEITLTLPKKNANPVKKNSQKGKIRSG